MGTELSQTMDTINTVVIEVEIPTLPLLEPSIIVTDDNGYQRDLWNDEYLNEPNWMYNNMHTYYYFENKTYILCSDENGTLSWEFEEDCVASNY